MFESHLISITMLIKPMETDNLTHLSDIDVLSTVCQIKHYYDVAHALYVTPPIVTPRSTFTRKRTVYNQQQNTACLPCFENRPVNTVMR